MLEEPVVDPYLERGRPRLLSALDLAMNSRLIGLGPVGVGSVGLRGQGDTPNGANGGVPVVGKEPTVGKLRRKRSRPEATLRHIGHFLVHYTTLDTLLYLMGTLGPTTIGNPRGAPNALHDFVYNNTYISLPRLYPTVVPPIIVEAVTTLGMAVGTWQGFSMGYHFFAALAVGSALWETESWELDLFDAPWKAESMLDLWGKRWHQLFRVSPPFPTVGLYANFPLAPLHARLLLPPHPRTVRHQPPPDLPPLRRLPRLRHADHEPSPRAMASGHPLRPLRHGRRDRDHVQEVHRSEGAWPGGTGLDVELDVVYGSTRFGRFLEFGGRRFVVDAQAGDGGV